MDFTRRNKAGSGEQGSGSGAPQDGGEGYQRRQRGGFRREYARKNKNKNSLLDDIENPLPTAPLKFEDDEPENSLEKDRFNEAKNQELKNINAVFENDALKEEEPEGIKPNEEVGTAAGPERTYQKSLKKYPIILDSNICSIRGKGFNISEYRYRQI